MAKKSRQVSLRMEPKHMRVLGELAERDCRSMAGQIAWLIEQEAKRRKLSATRPARRRATSAA